MSSKNDTNKADYTQFFQEFQGILKETMELLTQGEENDYRKAIDKINTDIETAMNALSSINNYLRTLQTVFSTLQTVFEWCSPEIVQEMSVDEIRQRLRMFLLPRTETLADNLLMAKKSSKHLLPYLESEVKRLPTMFKSLSYKSDTLFDILDYDATEQNTLFFHILSFLWEAKFDMAREKMNKIHTNTVALQEKQKKENKDSSSPQSTQPPI